MTIPDIVGYIFSFGLGLFFILYSRILNTRIKENGKNSGKKEILLRLLRNAMVASGILFIVIQLYELAKQLL